jgi:F0F1-type ATP synthase assembly protein I
MQQTTNRVGLTILGAALILGIVADALLRATPWGLNLALFTLAIFGGALIVARIAHISLSGAGACL